MARLSLRGVSRRFGDVRAVDGVSLDIAPGEFLTLLGDSGCGKTTLLRIIAGFTAPDEGSILRDGEDMTRVAPAARRMGVVFQSYALFPTKTVAGNIGFALRVAGASRQAAAARVAELAGIMELGPLLERYPHELSGGQQQRVALARALAPNPAVLLLDEPLSALDARIRSRLRGELRDIVDRLGVTAVYVTHDQEEALALSDRIAVMRQGRIAQLGTPEEIYHRPRSRFVAEFVGTANILSGVLRPGGVEAGGRLWPGPVPDGVPQGSPAIVVYRPEHLVPAEAATADVVGHVASKTFLGATLRLRVALPCGQALVVDCPSASAAGFGVGSPLPLRLDRARAVVVPDDRA